MKQKRFKAAGTVIISIVLALFLENPPETARGQILINDGNGLGEFSAYGIPVNAAFTAGLNEPQGIAVSGTNLFVVNYGNGTIGEYTTSGAIVNTNLISGLIFGAEGIAISGTNLFVANFNNGTIGEYTTSGTTNNARLIAGLTGPDGLAISGTNLFVGYSGFIGEYSTSGATNNAHLISGLINPAGLAISGTNLFVTEYGRNRIGEYTLSGAVVNSNLITVFQPNAIAVSGNSLFVAVSSGNVGEYTITGAVNNPLLFHVPNSSYIPFGIVVLPNTGLSVPTTLAVSLNATNATFSWPTNAFAYQLQTSPLLTPATWTLVTNTPVVTNGNYGVSLGPVNSAQFFRLQSIN